MDLIHQYPVASNYPSPHTYTRDKRMRWRLECLRLRHNKLAKKIIAEHQEQINVLEAENKSEEIEILKKRIIALQQLFFDQSLEHLPKDDRGKPPKSFSLDLFEPINQGNKILFGLDLLKLLHRKGNWTSGVATMVASRRQENKVSNGPENLDPKKLQEKRNPALQSITDQQQIQDSDDTKP